jgi:signal peptidase I
VSESRRSVPARIGIAALNLIWPGLGLLRLRRTQAGLRLLAAPFLLTLATLAAYALLPVFTFVIWVVVLLLALLIGLGVYAVAIVMTWRASMARVPDPPWWARWYGLLGIAIGCFAAYWPVPDLYLSYYRSFYLPAESMEPILLKGDRLVANMRPPWDVRRGTLVLVAAPGGAIYVKRIAALSGDRIALRDGVVILNGRPVPQRLIRYEQRDEGFGEIVRARRLAEQFPGESRPHEIYDVGYRAFDDMSERVVAPGRIFLLGDNRDHSADSRVSIAEMGLEQVPVSAIRGQPLFYYWSSDRDRIGEPLNP